MPIISGLIVSVDAFFIGLSLGLQKRCKFLHLVVINAFLFGLCVMGFFIADRLYKRLTFDMDTIVGVSFISLGLWCVLRGLWARGKESRNTIVLVGLVMSIEAMMITMGLTFMFLSFVVPVTVALAHFGYSALSFYLAGTKYVKKMPVVLSHIVSGLALVVYGLMAIFVEFGV